MSYRAISRIRRLGRMVGHVVLGFLLILLWLWATLEIWYTNLPLTIARWGLAIAFFIGAPAVWFRYRRRHALALLLPAIILLGIWRTTIQPSNQRNWSEDQAILPYAEITGETVTIRNIRNCSYITTEQYTVSHYDKTFAWNDLESLWYIVEPFSSRGGAAHTFLSFGLAGGDFVAVSVEIRKEKGEAFSPLRGLFKQYEIMYVIGDERDLIQLRTNFRKDDVYLYPVRATPAQIREVLLDVLMRANHLRDHPEFYNTLTNTCATNIVWHLERVSGSVLPLSWSILLPGYSDQLAYNLGLLKTDLPFPEARRRFHINHRAREYADEADFSQRIRGTR